LKACKWHDLTFRNKQLQMLSFLWELFYELTLSSTANVSESPGFEKFCATLPVAIESVELASCIL
jgi:hypothetical protein